MTGLLLSPYKLGSLELKNRMVMAPMTRSRAMEGNVPSPMAATYYEQRAGAGLIISEAAQVDPLGVGYIDTPGIHSSEQIAGWRHVTKAVHDKGGKIFLQLWHVGRVSHPSFHGGKLPVAPSAIGYEGKCFTPKGFEPVVTPRALLLEEIPEIVSQFKSAARNAKLAGFDGVEIHGANGYLLDQFLRSSSNQRQDAYGGSPENRARFGYEIAKAVCEEWEPQKVGYRLSPQDNPGVGMFDATPEKTFSTIVKMLNDLPLAYIHILENKNASKPIMPALRQICMHPMIANAGYDHASGEEVLAQNNADLVAYGVLFLANPDLPERFKENAPLNTPIRETFYGGGEKGYVDYPLWS